MYVGSEGEEMYVIFAYYIFTVIEKTRETFFKIPN